MNTWKEELDELNAKYKELEADITRLSKAHNDHGSLRYKDCDKCAELDGLIRLRNDLLARTYAESRRQIEVSRRD
jgi:hypothetical protein